MKETLTLILVIVLIILVAILILIMLKKKPIEGSFDGDNITKTIKDELDRSSRNLAETNTNLRLGIGEDYQKLISNLNDEMAKIKENIGNSMQKGFEGTNDVIKDFQGKFAIMEDNQKNINNLASQIVSLEKILGNNKSTGNFGEALLGQALYAYFGEDPKLYQLQYKFEGGTPDAVIFMPNELICIDSKFPVHFYKQYLATESESEKEDCLKNLLKEAKLQAKDISDKYIIPGRTSEYACMFVPSDSLLSLIHNKLSDFVNECSKLKIILLSPSTIIPFISSLKNAKLEFERNANAAKLYNELLKLSEEFTRFADRWNAQSKEIKDVLDKNKLLDTTTDKIIKKFNDIKEMKFDEEEK